MDKVMFEFNDRLCDLASEHPLLAGVENGIANSSGFAYPDNNARSDFYLHIGIGREAKNLGSPRYVSGERIDAIAGTTLLTSFSLDCPDPQLRQEIEKEYLLLRRRLREIEEKYPPE